MDINNSIAFDENCFLNTSTVEGLQRERFCCFSSLSSLKDGKLKNIKSQLAFDLDEVAGVRTN